jgi:hypothetical protein
MSQQKMDFLEHEGLLNPKPQRVIHPLFDHGGENLPTLI